MNKTMAILATLVMLLSASVGLPALQSCSGGKNGEPRAVTCEPSLAQVAQKLREQRSQEKLKNVPVYTNDNLPTGPGGLSVVGGGAAAGGAQGRAAESAGANAEAAQKAAYLRSKLARAQQHLAMHQAELSVLQQQFSQSKMQYYPNPYKTLMQEYSRQNINKLAGEVDDKKQQIAEDQQETARLQDQLQQVSAQLGPLNAAPEAAAGFVPPPGVKPGTAAYLQAHLDASRQQLATAREQQKLAENQLSLLKLQQLRTLNPNLQSELAAQIAAKQTDLQNARQAVEKAQQEITKLEQQLSAAEAAHTSSR